MQTITYDEIQRLLDDEHVSMNAAEVHGTLTGALVASVGYFFEDWLRDTLPEGGAGSESAALLQSAYENTAQALAGMAMDFEPLLPDDEDPIVIRAAALSNWCRGFLQGFNSNVTLETNDLPEDIGEILNDFNDIIDVDIDTTENEEEAENAYAELVEFVRVGAQLVFDELRALRAQERSSLN